MTLVAEDGTGLENANAYIDVAFADSYHASAGVTSWAALSTQSKEVAIIKATRFIDRRWGPKTRCLPLLATQALLLPATQLYSTRTNTAIEGIPTAWKQACAEYALISTTEELFLVPTSQDNGQIVSSFREKIGPMEEETKYQAGGAISVFKKFPSADLLMSQFALTSGRVIRA